MLTGETPFYVDLLKSELSRRTDRNPQYSLRAFAKTLRIDPSVLSKVLSRKMDLSLKSAKGVVLALALEPEAGRGFLHSVVQEKNRHQVDQVDTPEEMNDWKVQELSTETFRIISQMHHYAILELTFVKGFKPEPRWIAAQLGVSLTEAHLAIERLIKAGLLEKKNGRLVKTKKNITTADKHLSTSAHRAHQKQVLERSLRALEEIDPEKRSHTSMTMAIESAKLPIARKMIEEFTNALCQFLEKGQPDQVYELGISVFPLQMQPRKAKPDGIRPSPSEVTS